MSVRSGLLASSLALMGIHLLLEPGTGPLTPSQRRLIEICRDDCDRLDTSCASP
jgi:hypothetical protein